MNFIILFLFSFLTLESNPDEIIIDSKMTFAQAIAGSKAPKNMNDSLELIDVQYYSFDGKLHQGQLVMNKLVSKEIKEIFELIKKEKFPINKCIPIVKYNWSDDSSMEDNNTSSFCFRTIAGTTRLSNHARGLAIDINPFYNPVVYPDGKIIPRGAKYIKQRAGTFSKENKIVQEFLRRGWRWGGDFNSYKDNHHFDKQE